MGHYNETPVWIFYAIFAVCLLAVGISAYTLVQVNSIKTNLQPEEITINDFLHKLTSHDEMADYKGIAPANVVQITNNNIADLQGQIQGLDISYIGSYIVQYNDSIIIYDFEKDQIAANIQIQTPQSQLPVDFFERLINHIELQGVEAETPTGGVLDQESLVSLKQQFPDVYQNANLGDFLLRYSDRLIIYNYEKDEVIGAFKLG